MTVQIRKKWVIILSVLAAAMLAATGIVYALFTSYKTYQFNFDANANANLTLSLENSKGIKLESGAIVSETLTLPGQKSEITATVTNGSSSDVALSYSLRLEFPVQNSAGADNADNTNSVILWQDGKPLGGLRQLLVSGTRENAVSGTETFYYYEAEVKLPLYMGERRTHRLEFEYHIGAAQGQPKRTFDWDMTVGGRSTGNTGKFLFTGSAEALDQLARQNSKMPDAHAGKTVYLTGDIDLGRDLVLSGNAFDIDLNGYQLNLNGHSLSMEGSGAMRIESSRAGGSVVTGGKKIVSDSQNGILLVDPSLISDGTLSAVRYSENLLAEELAADLENQFETGAGDSFAASPEFSAYPYTLFSASSRLTVSADRSISFQRGNTTEYVPLEVSGGAASAFEKTLEVKILGKTDNTFTDFLKNNAPELLSAVSADAPLTVSSDLFLPERGRELGVTVKWVSENPDALSSSGKRAYVERDTRVNLIALITANGETHVKTFYFNVVAKDARELLKEFVQLNALNFDSIGKTLKLPKEGDAELAKYGISQLSYAVPTEFISNLLLGGDAESGYTLTLLKSDPQDYFYLNFTAKVAGSSSAGGLETVDFPVYVSLSGTVSLVDQAFQNALDALEKRPGKLSGIELPASGSFSEDVSVTYRLAKLKKDGGEFIQQIYYENPDDVANYVSVAENIVSVIPENFPIANTTVYLVASYSYKGGEAQSYILELPLAGVVHNDEEGIPDVTLYTRLCALFDNGDFLLTRDEIDSKPDVKSLEFSNCAIERLDGLQYFPQLEVLGFADNQLSDINALEGCFNVRELDLSNSATNVAGNKISDLSALAGMKLLTKLNLSSLLDVNLTPLKNAVNLEWLDISRMRFTVGDELNFLENYRKLWYLNVAYSFEYKTVRTYDYSLISAYQKSAEYAGSIGKTRTYYVTETASSALTPMVLRDSQTQFTNVLSNVSNVYRIGSTIYLPWTVSYYSPFAKAVVVYPITWSVPELYSGIIAIDPVNKTATVTPPIADKTLTLIGTINHEQNRNDVPLESNSDFGVKITVQKIFEIVAMSGENSATVQVGSEYLPAAAVIPDPELRYYLFRNFDANSDKKLSSAELNSVKNVNLSNLGVAQVKGLELCNFLETLDLTGCPVTDLRYVNHMAGGISSITFSNADYNFEEINSWLSGAADRAVELRLNFSKISDIGTEKFEAILLDLYKRFVTKGGKLSIEINSLTWNPVQKYLEAAISSLQDYVLLSFGSTITLPASVSFRFAGKSATVFFEYNFASSSLNLSNNVISAKKLTVFEEIANYTAIIPKAVIDGVTYTFDTSKDVFAKKMLFAILQADYTFQVETSEQNPDKTYKKVNLYDAVSDPTVLQTILDAYLDTKNTDNNAVVSGIRTVKRTIIDKITSLTFGGTTDSGLKGIDLFYSSKLNTLTVKNYHGYPASYENVEGLDPKKTLVASKFNSLKTLIFDKGIPNLFDFANLAITNLTVHNCLDIRMIDGSGNSVFQNGGTDANALSMNLTNLDLSNNNIRNFSAIASLYRVTNLKIYGNPASQDPNTASSTGYVYSAYKNLQDNFPNSDFLYEVLDAGVYWTLNTRTSKYGITLRKNAGTETFVPGLERCNVVSNGDTVELPQNVVYFPSGSSVSSGVSVPISWKISAEGALVQSGSTSTYTFTNNTKNRAYLTLTGTSEGFSKPVVYTFLVNGTRTAGDTVSDWIDGFLLQGAETNLPVLADPWFFGNVYELLNQLPHANSVNSGIFTPEQLTEITEINLPESLVCDIRGIKHLTGLKTLNLNRNSVRDVSQLQYLVNLEQLYLNSNKITTLWFDKSDTLTSYEIVKYTETARTTVNQTLAVDKFSVFYQMKKLNTLMIQSNPLIDSYMPIVARDNRIEKTVKYNGIDYNPAVQYRDDFTTKPAAGSTTNNFTLKTVGSQPHPFKNIATSTGAEDSNLSMFFTGELTNPFPMEYFAAWMEAGRKDGWKPGDSFGNSGMQQSGVYFYYYDNKSTPDISVAGNGFNGYYNSTKALESIYEKDAAGKYKYLENIGSKSNPVYGISLTKSGTIWTNELLLPITGSERTIRYYAAPSVNGTFKYGDGSSGNPLARGQITVSGELSSINRIFNIIAMTDNSNYRTIPVKVSDSANATVEKIDASLKFPDSAFRGAVFSYYVSDSSISADLTPDLIGDKTGTDFNYSKRLIEDLSGLDYIINNLPAATSGRKSYTFDFSFNGIKSFPDLSGVTRTDLNLTFKFTGCRILSDLGNLGSAGAKNNLVSLDLSRCLALTSSQLKNVNETNLPNLTSLNLSGMNLADYSFLSGLPKKMSSVYLNKSTEYTTIPGQIFEAENLEWIRRMLMFTENVSSSEKGLNSANIAYYGVSNAMVFSEYLYLQEIYQTSQTIWLPAFLNQFDTQFSVLWDVDAAKIDPNFDPTITLVGAEKAKYSRAENHGAWYYSDTVNGQTVKYLLFRMKAGFADSSFPVKAQLSYSDGGVTRKTYQEDITLWFSKDATPAELFTDATVHTNAGDTEGRLLSSFMPDTTLRYYVLAALSKYDPTISATKDVPYFVVSKMTDLRISEEAIYNTSLSFSKNSKFGFVSDLTGLSEFKDVSNLLIFSANTKNFTPLAGMTNLVSLTLRKCTLEDTAFFSEMKKLKSLDLVDTSYPHLSFVNDMNLTSLTNVGAETNSGVSFVKNALARQEVYQGLKDYQTYLTVVTDFEKIGSIVLNNLKLTVANGWAFQKFGGEDSYYLLGAPAGLTLTVPETAVYDGRTAAITVRPISYGNISVSGNTVTFLPNGGRSSIAKFVAVAYFDGVYSERYFEVRL